jgi:hypothetical protein
MSERKHFLYAIEGYDDPTRHQLYPFFSNLLHLNASLMLMGDSMMYQLLHGISCEVRRENFYVSNYYDPHPKQVCISEGKCVDIDFIKMNIVNAIDKARDNIVARVLKQDVIFIFVNLGLWYNDFSKKGKRRKDHLGHDIQDMLLFFDDLAKTYSDKKFVYLWLEKSSQHFDSSFRGDGHIHNGYFVNNHDPDKLCVPIKDASIESDWRLTVLWNTFKNFTFSGGSSRNSTRLEIIPFRDVSLPLWDMHPTRVETGPDCTHFCWSPLLYQSVFSHIARVSEEVLQLWSSNKKHRMEY